MAVKIFHIARHREEVEEFRLRCLEFGLIYFKLRQLFRERGLKTSGLL